MKGNGQMCGICGYISKKKIEDSTLQCMAETMKHRGPDDEGKISFQRKDYFVGMAHTRLAIIDLSKNGHQPMCSDDQNIVIVFNGEIYNFKELKEELGDYPYKSNTDTEVLLAAYKKWGIQCIEHCNGMFGVAIYDKKKDILYLARDRMGQKPVYYYLDDQTFVFSSEMKGIMACTDIKLKINRDVLGQYLVKGCIASPNTIFEKVYKVNPGEIIKIKDFDIKKYFYWHINRIYSQKKKTYHGKYNNAKKDLIQELEKAIDRRMVADVPIGIFLSGGYDSSLVTFLAQKGRKDKVKTFSIGIKNSLLDEAKYARKISDFIGTDHRELYISEDDMLEMIKQIPQYYDEPFADSSQIATMLVSKMAKEDVTVVLTGDGGDELFAGYPIYLDEKIAQNTDKVGGILRSLGNMRGFSKIYYRLPFPIRMISENRNKKSKTQFNYWVKVDTARKIIKKSRNENYDETYIPEKKWNIKRMLLDMQTYLPDDLLCKVDRASMMFSIEARSPFMDVNVVELALSMPQRFKLHGRKTKRILKDIVWDLLPKELLDRPKSGFEVPIDQWLRNELCNDLIMYSRAEYLENQGVFIPKATENLVDRYLRDEVNQGRGQKINTIIWAFFVFQMWYNKFSNIIEN